MVDTADFANTTCPGHIYVAPSAYDTASLFTDDSPFCASLAFLDGERPPTIMPPIAILQHQPRPLTFEIAAAPETAFLVGGDVRVFFAGSTVVAAEAVLDLDDSTSTLKFDSVISVVDVGRAMTTVSFSTSRFIDAQVSATMELGVRAATNFAVKHIAPLTKQPFGDIPVLTKSDLAFIVGSTKGGSTSTLFSTTKEFSVKLDKPRSPCVLRKFVDLAMWFFILPSSPLDHLPAAVAAGLSFNKDDLSRVSVGSSAAKKKHGAMTLRERSLLDSHLSISPDLKVSKADFESKKTNLMKAHHGAQTDSDLAVILGSNPLPAYEAARQCYANYLMKHETPQHGGSKRMAACQLAKPCRMKACSKCRGVQRATH